MKYMAKDQSRLSRRHQVVGLTFDLHVESSVSERDALVDGGFKVGLRSDIELLKVGVSSKLVDHCCAYVQTEDGTGLRVSAIMVVSVCLYWTPTESQLTLVSRDMSRTLRRDFLGAERFWLL